MPTRARAEVVPTRWAVTPPPVAHAARVRPPGPTARPAARRHTSTAYALWFFLGALGAHRFYLGRPASGLAYLLAFVGSPWTLFLSLPVLGVCLLVDAVVIPALTRGANRRQGWVR